MDLPGTMRDVDRAFLERLVERCRDDERVAALFLGGSHASDTAHGWSDLDWYLAATDDAYTSLRDERHGLMHALRYVVFLEEHEDFGFLMLLYMYADGVHGEMALTPERDLAEVHAGPYLTLLDRTGVLEARPFPPRRLDEDSRGGLIRGLLVWFWYDRRLLDVALARGHLWTAHHYLDRCRRRCVDLARLVARPDAWPGGYDKVEDVADPTTLDRLADTVVALDAQAMSRAAVVLTDRYRELGRTLARAHGVEYPDRLDALVSPGR